MNALVMYTFLYACTSSCMRACVHMHFDRHACISIDMQYNRRACMRMRMLAHVHACTCAFACMLIMHAYCMLVPHASAVVLEIDFSQMINFSNFI